MYATLEDVARAKGMHATYVSRVLRLTLLAPEIVEAILDGRQPAEMGLDDLLAGVPTDWKGQWQTLSNSPLNEGLRTRHPSNTSGRVGTSTRFFLSSAPLTPERLAAALRGHLAIENSLDWVLDVTSDKDRARNRRDSGPENLAILRRLNLLNKTRPNMSISRKRKRSCWSDAFARTIIGQMQ